MATTKSTVVGIRLDHERRAWVEAEAARLGVSVRGLFEGMIDEARLGEMEATSPAVTELATVPGPTPRVPLDATSAQQEPSPSAQPRGVDAESLPRQKPVAPSLPGIGLVTAIPGGLVRGACILTANLIESSGRCATNRLASCALTRHWVDRSL
jgi:hypothetical protein